MFQHITSWSIDSCISDSTTWHPPPVYSVRNVLGVLRKKTDEKNEKNTCSWNAQEKNDEKMMKKMKKYLFLECSGKKLMKKMKKILVLGMLRKKTDEQNEKILLEDLS